MEGIAEETYLGYTSTTSPLLLWLTVSADWHSGDKHQLAAFLKEFKHPYGGESDNQIAAVYVLGDDGPKEATWTLMPDVQFAKPARADLRIICAEYDVDALKEIPNWA